MQVSVTLSSPSANHLASGSVPSRPLVKGLRQTRSSRACLLQKAEGSAAASSRSFCRASGLPTHASLAKSCGGGKTRSSRRAESKDVDGWLFCMVVCLLGNPVSVRLGAGSNQGDDAGGPGLFRPLQSKLGSQFHPARRGR